MGIFAMYSSVFMFLFYVCAAEDVESKRDGFIIACRSTDFDCFKKQYKYLRDHILMGNQILGIPHLEPMVFHYRNETCIGVSGLESSELVAIQMDMTKNELTWILELPFKVQQLTNDACVKAVGVSDSKDIRTNLIGNDNKVFPRNDAIATTATNNTIQANLKRFSGNATIKITYPCQIRKKNGEIYLTLFNENLDMILDIPDFSDQTKNQRQNKLYELSEWAYGIVQHIDAAQLFALPYSLRVRNLTELVPMRKLFLLYPDEEYSTLKFKYSDADDGSTKCIKFC